MRILMADDDRNICEDLSVFMESFKNKVDRAYDGKQALEMAKQNAYDLVISDVNMPVSSGIELAGKIRENKIDTDIVLISGIADIIRTINSMDLGIMDFLTKPVKMEKLEEILDYVKRKKALEKKEQSKSPDKGANEKKTVSIDDYVFGKDFTYFHKTIGAIGIYSERLASIFNKLIKLQDFPEIPVLIEGETGTGKEIIAKYIHYNNPKNEGQFIGLNCSALPRELFESELFGFEKGSFTGADSKGRDGKIKLAENGTLFLDEISEIPMDLQAKLLRILQEREYFKVGGNKKQVVNTRICCATNLDLQSQIEKGLFREDLYYRLNVCQVKIPPLRDRKEEIIPLAISFIREFKKQMKKNIESVETDALNRLVAYDWPGNIRELKNTISKVVLFSEGKRLHEKEFSAILFSGKRTSRCKELNLENFEIPAEPFDLNKMMDAIVKKTLKKFNGNKTKTAEYLGLTRIQLYGRFK